MVPERGFEPPTCGLGNRFYKLDLLLFVKIRALTNR
jgi:hypothetical protein